MDRYVRPHFARYVGKHFEGMVTDLFDSFNRHGLLPFVFTRIGSEWHRGEEIDIVCLAEDEHRILFCECRGQDGVDAAEVIAGLRREEHFCVVVRSFSHQVPESEDIFLDLDDCMARVEEIRAEAVRR